MPGSITDFESHLKEALLEIDTGQTNYSLTYDNFKPSSENDNQLSSELAKIEDDISAPEDRVIKLFKLLKLLSESQNKIKLSNTGLSKLKNLVTDSKVDDSSKRMSIEILCFEASQHFGLINWLEKVLVGQKDLVISNHILKLLSNPLNNSYKVNDITVIEEALFNPKLYFYALAVLKNTINNHSILLSPLTIEHLTKILEKGTLVPQSEKSLDFLTARFASCILFLASRNNQYLEDLSRLENVLAHTEDEDINLFIYRTLEVLTSRGIPLIDGFKTLVEKAIKSEDRGNEIKECSLRIYSNLITKQHYKPSEDIIKYLGELLLNSSEHKLTSLISHLFTTLVSQDKAYSNIILNYIITALKKVENPEKIIIASELLSIVKLKEGLDEELLLELISILDNSDILPTVFRKIYEVIELAKAYNNKAAPAEELVEVEDILETAEDLFDDLTQNQFFDTSLEEKTLDNLLDEISKINNNPTILALVDNGILKNYILQTLEAFCKDSLITPQGKAINLWNEENIGIWADKVKQTSKASDRDFIPEMIAVIKQANILHSNNDPRTAQLLSILLFLITDNACGLIAQIATGEGKSTTASILATIKVLQGKKVDVTTSSSILAQRDVAERSNFFKMFHITAGHNCDKQQNEGFRYCYALDIVYGAVSDFQYDLLKHEYKQLGTRGERGFKDVVVIIDEVDSMLIDESSKIAMLSNPIAGSEYLEALFIVIWDELNRFEQQTIYLAEENQWVYVVGAFKYENGRIILQNEDGRIYQIDNIIAFKIEYLKNHLKEVILREAIIIPTHLKEFALNQIEAWIKSSILAQQFMENRDYVIVPNEKDTYIIAPVDYLNTGLIHAKTSWTDGLHQFLQIKHGLKITSENLTTSFISNLGYFKLYGNNIYGMTGTLGSSEVQELLKFVYHVDLAFIPTYKPKQFTELPGIISHGEREWLENIEKTVNLQIASNRAVLLICETIHNVELIKKLLITQHPTHKIKVYSRNDNDENTSVSEVIDSKEIIIATNLAGRGTDIKTTKKLESNGGLHVCITFLPTNLRVEEQAFGRTSRQGNQGTAQLVINDADIVRNLKINYEEIEEIEDIEQLKLLRNHMERDRLEKARLYEANRIMLEDLLFSLFCKFSNELKARENNKYKLAQLEERWGMAFKNIKHANEKEKEEALKAGAKDTKKLNDLLEQKALNAFNKFFIEMIHEYSSGYKIIRNPAYLVNEAFNKMGNLSDFNNKYNTSLELLSMAANLDENFSVPAHYNRAYVLIRNKDCANYKQEAYTELMTAKMQIEQVLIPNLEIIQIASIKSKDSQLSKQIISKIELLKLQIQYIDLSAEKIKNSDEKSSIEISESKLLREFFSNDNTPEDEIKELNSFGVHHLFDVKEIKPPKNDRFDLIFMAVAAVVQIGLGVVCAMGGQVYLGASLIVEGLYDSLSAMKIANGESFDWKNYFTHKSISAVVTIVTIGAETLLSKFTSKGAAAKELTKGVVQEATKDAAAKSVYKAAEKVAKKALIETGKQVTKESLKQATKQELLKITLKEVGKKMVINTAIDRVANQAMQGALVEFKDEVGDKVRDVLQECLNDSTTNAQLMHLLELDHFNGNNYYYNLVFNAALDALKAKSSILTSVVSQVINDIAIGSSSNVVKSVATTVKVAKIAGALIKINELADKIGDKLTQVINQAGHAAPNLASILVKKLSPIIDLNDANEIIVILEKEAVIINGRFTQGSDERLSKINFGSLEKHVERIIPVCKKLYQSQLGDYKSAQNKIIDDLTRYVTNGVLSGIRSEVMHPIASPYLAKAATMVSDVIAKTMEEFKPQRFFEKRKTEQKLNEVERKIVSNIGQYEAEKYSYAVVTGVSSGEQTALSKKQETRRALKEDFEDALGGYDEEEDYGSDGFDEGGDYDSGKDEYHSAGEDDGRHPASRPDLKEEEEASKPGNTKNRSIVFNAEKFNPDTTLLVQGLIKNSASKVIEDSNKDNKPTSFLDKMKSGVEAFADFHATGLIRAQKEEKAAIEFGLTKTKEFVQENPELVEHGITLLSMVPAAGGAIKTVQLGAKTAQAAKAAKNFYDRTTKGVEKLDPIEVPKARVIEGHSSSSSSLQKKEVSSKLNLRIPEEKTQVSTFKVDTSKKVETQKELFYEDKVESTTFSSSSGGEGSLDSLNKKPYNPREDENLPALKADRLAKKEKFNISNIKGDVSKELKGKLGEERAAFTMDYLEGYKAYTPKLKSNQGMDHVFVKYGANDVVEDIMIVESKFKGEGGAPKLATSGPKIKVQQLSDAWVFKQIRKLEHEHPEVYKILTENPDKIRLKANVLDAEGNNKWYDYGNYNPNKAIDRKKAVRNKKG